MWRHHRCNGRTVGDTYPAFVKRLVYFVTVPSDLSSIKPAERGDRAERGHASKPAAQRQPAHGFMPQGWYRLLQGPIGHGASGAGIWTGNQPAPREDRATGPPAWPVSLSSFCLEEREGREGLRRGPHLSFAALCGPSRSSKQIAPADSGFGAKRGAPHAATLRLFARDRGRSDPVKFERSLRATIPRSDPGSQPMPMAISPSAAFIERFPYFVTVP